MICLAKTISDGGWNALPTHYERRSTDRTLGMGRSELEQACAALGFISHPDDTDDDLRVYVKSHTASAT